MHFDSFSIGMICGALILGLIAALIVGSQDAADARAIADCSFAVLFVLLLLSSVRLATTRDGDSTGLGLVILFFALIASIGVGCRIARSRPPGPRPADPKSMPWDDELA